MAGVKIKDKIFKLEGLAVCVVHWIGIFMFFLLSLASLIYTRYFPADYDGEIPLNRVAIFPLTLLGMAVIALGIVYAGNWILKDAQKEEQRLATLLWAVLLWVAAVGTMWVVISRCDPISDQLMVVSSAQRFLEGNYGRFDYSKYLFMHPHQIGLVAYSELIFGIFGRDNNLAFLMMNVVWIVVAVFAGYRITRFLFQEKRISAYYLLLAGSCAPFLIYSSYFYGDVLAASLSLFSIWQLLRYLCKGKKSGVVFLMLGMSSAVLIRNNSMIVAIACLCVLLVQALSRLRWQYLLCAVLMMVGIAAGRQGLRGYYASCIGRPLNEGMPMILYISMGMQEGDKEAGWYNGESMYTYQSVCEYDGVRAAEIGKEEIRERAKEFVSHPLYAADFYWRKFNSQWSEPTYGCFIMTYATEHERGSIANSAYLGKINRLLDAFMDSYQLLIYGMVLLLLISSRKEKKALEWYLPLIVIIGGILFHTIWEAKSRYVLPYFIMMLPMAAAGLSRGWGLLQNRRKKDETVTAG